MADAKEEIAIPSLSVEPTAPVFTDQEKEIAVQANQEFENKNYDSAASSVNKLLGLRPDDVKATHNKAVIEFYKTEFTQVDDLKKNLSEICKKGQINIDSVDALEDVDYSVLFFNQAVLAYHQSQYQDAIDILDKLFQFIESLDEALALKVYFLLLELYLCTQQLQKALGLISYIEGFLLGHTGDNPEKSEEKETKESGKDSEGTDPAADIHKLRLQQYKAKCYMMLKTTKACKREIKNLMNSRMHVAAIYLRSQLEYMRGNMRKALKMLNTALNTGYPWLFKDTGDDMTAMYYNNVGCIHFYLGKPNLGCFYFNKAIQEHENSLKDVRKDNGGLPLHFSSPMFYYQTLYNLGIQFLFAKKPLIAFNYLIEVVQLFLTNPRIWLRIAECCIQIQQQNSNGTNKSDEKRNIVQNVSGAGIHTKIILNSHVPDMNKSKAQTQSSESPEPTLEFASLCLRNALVLLPDENAPSANSGDQISSSGFFEDDHNNSFENNSSVMVFPANSIQSPEIQNLKNSILVTSSYVSLCLGDIVLALKHAKNLLAQPRISGAHRLLGHLYCAEALIFQDKIADAITHLNPETIKDISLNLSPLPDAADNKSQEKLESKEPPWLSWLSSSSVKQVFSHNLAVAYALRGENERAWELLSLIGATGKSIAADIPVQSIMLGIYVQLQTGQVDEVKATLKQFCPQIP